MSEYYKSLISDDDVIKELIKESQRREGKLVTPRLKPNLNFLQRTVNGLVSNNNRIDKGIDTFRSDYLKDANIRKYRVPVYKSTSHKIPLVDYAFERRVILEAKGKWAKHKENERKEKEATKRKWDPQKLSFGSDLDDTTASGDTSLNKSQRQSYKQILEKLDYISTDSDSDGFQTGNMKKSTQVTSDKDAIVLSSDENEESAAGAMKNKKEDTRRKKKSTKKIHGSRLKDS